MCDSNAQQVRTGRQICVCVCGDLFKCVWDSFVSFFWRDICYHDVIMCFQLFQRICQGHSTGQTIQNWADGCWPGCECPPKSCTPWVDVCKMACDFWTDFVKLADFRARYGQLEFELLRWWHFINQLRGNCICLPRFAILSRTLLCAVPAKLLPQM